MARIASTPRMVVVGLAMTTAALGLFSMSVGAAPSLQEPYPPPYPSPCPCAVVASAAEVAPPIGECVPIICLVTDAEGTPKVGAECTVSILSQPGTDATLTPTSIVTDEKGEATAELCVGGVPGSIVVLAEAECCQGQVQVTAQLPAPSGTPPQPISPAAAPATGAGTGGGDSWAAPLIAIWSAIALAAGAVLVWRVGSRRRRSS
jgi:hypothetical protein